MTDSDDAWRGVRRRHRGDIRGARFEGMRADFSRGAVQDRRVRARRGRPALRRAGPRFYGKAKMLKASNRADAIAVALSRARGDVSGVMHGRKSTDFTAELLLPRRRRADTKRE